MGLQIPAWIRALFPTFTNGAGTGFPVHGTVKFRGPTITDDPANDQTIIDFNAGQQKLVSGVTWNIDSGSAPDTLIDFDTSVANSKAKLPAPTAGRVLWFTDKTGNAAANNATILPNAAETINGAASFVISTNRAMVRLESDGTNWFATLSAPTAGGGPLASFGGNLDATSTSTQQWVSSISGASGTGTKVAIGSAGVAFALQFLASVSAASIGQDIAASDVATKNITINAQPPFASATGTNRDSGDFIVNSAASVGGATSHNGGLRVQYAGTDVFRAGVMSGTLLNSYGAVGAAWFGSTYANAPTNGNWSIAANNNYTYLNGVNGVFVYANSAGSPSYLFGPTNLQMGAPYSVNHMAIDFVAATLWHFGAGATASATIQYDGQTTDVATLVLALKGQAAWASAATNIDGGWLTLQGGAAKGASSGSDGPIKCLSPFGMEGLTIQPSAGANAFTNAQSANGCFIFGPTQASAYTITLQRKITDKTLIIVRNNCVGLATISYLTGGTVTVATNTSALIYSDGTNLQKLLIGT